MSTFRGIADKVAKGKSALQEALEEWPMELGGHGDLEHAVELAGRCEDLADTAADDPDRFA